MGGSATGGSRVDRDRAIEIGTEFMAEAVGMLTPWVFAGSIRREKETVGDVDIVCVRTDEILAFLMKKFGLKKNGTPQTRGLVEGVQLDLYLCTDIDFGAQMFTWTGSPSWNIRMRAVAKSKNLLLNQYGLWTLERKLLASETEEEIMTALGLAFVEPKNRD